MMTPVLPDMNPPTGLRNARERLRLRHLRLLDLIETTGSLSAAAAAMHLAQPAASQMLRELESAFGKALVVRSASGSVLSPAGRIALQGLRLALGAVEVAAEAMRQSEPRALVRLAMIPAVALRAMPLLMQRFSGREDAPRLRLLEASAPAVLAALRNGDVDGAVTRLEPVLVQDLASDIEVLPLAMGHLIVACSASHPWLASTDPLSRRRLRDAEWILPPASTGMRELIGRYFSDDGIAPPVPVVESASLHTNLATVASSNLLTVASASVVRAHAKGAGLAELPLVHPLPAVRTVFLARAHMAFPALAMVRDVLKALPS